MAQTNILEVKGIKKSFGGVHALKGVDLTIKKGETHCLAGENGCGKSTIIKVISGFYKPDAGTIEVDGKGYPVMTPAEAIKAGIQVIYQDFSVFPNLTVVENLALNQVLANKQKIVRKKEFRRIAEEAVQKINFEVDLDALVETLPVADKQLIAISRALLDNAKLIIMDEPTTALTKKEVNRLFEIIAELKKSGVTILFVSHKLDEVFEISDRITILRNGENVISCPTEEMTEEKFAYYMTGRHFETQKKELQENRKYGKVVLEAEDLSAEGFEHVNFQLRQGEILGITGQLGSGRTELSLALFGMNRPTAGKIRIEGKEVCLKDVKAAQKQGIALVPEDRLTEGLFLPQSIIRNITVTRLDQLAKRAGVLNPKKVSEESQTWVDEIGVATKNHEFPVQTLSGGNQQKVVLARWLSTHPKVLILNGPTVGVDIGAKYDIHRLLRTLAAEGMAIIVVSDDAAEIIATCDRAIVMQGGKVTGTLEAGDLNVTALTRASV
ncbi:sugar ABC transporter ATP-binding protein [Suipraeoptans intestinalis]|uniref:Sugar ABC transporter ATP-binding protein n=1 Tax=Suipraeoptans intestinalis TaxID=2606628 RepID=A0A6N7USV2_9FIRM|nr:sugar ABC transporter ATP-binding protein [Suipraeoptans intestinalis]MDD7770099.1 sugar ABC transporter ATP-binding protein [Suipraeoptans intestinalis]MDY3122007.1 sugar ABC transporter ATP-binding protein [Suipraeoptans intestinalis]MSR94221.1 sugar ABC transporter ATP-binding protein [Suipraeoptans intestinalis]